MKAGIALGILLVLSTMAAFAAAADYQCVFSNRGQVNCNAVSAGDTFCYNAGPGAVANNPARAITCTNNAPGQTGTIVCQLSNYNGPANSIRCSNTTYLASGPTLVPGTGSADSCTYNDCELNQVSCASGYAYQQCVPDSSSPGCNKWQATNCIGNAACYSSTPAQLAQCMGVQASEITSRNGVYFRAQAQSGDGAGNSPQGQPGPRGNTGTTDLRSALYQLGIVGNGNVNVIDEGDSPPAHYNATVSNGTVTRVATGDAENPKYTITINASASAAIKASADPLKEALAQYKGGAITVETSGIFERLQLFVFRFFI